MREILAWAAETGITTLLVGGFAVTSYLLGGPVANQKQEPEYGAFPPAPEELRQRDDTGYFVEWSESSAFIRDAGPADEAWLQGFCTHLANKGSIREESFPNFPHYKAHRIGAAQGSAILATRRYQRGGSMDEGDFEMITVFLKGGLPADEVRVNIPQEAPLLYTSGAIYWDTYSIGCATFGTLAVRAKARSLKSRSLPSCRRARRRSKK